MIYYQGHQPHRLVIDTMSCYHSVVFIVLWKNRHVCVGSRWARSVPVSGVNSSFVHQNNGSGLHGGKHGEEAWGHPNAAFLTVGLHEGGRIDFRGSEREIQRLNRWIFELKIIVT